MNKSDSDEQKWSSEEKINMGDTTELTDRQTVMTKKTPSVAAPGDTNPSDATVTDINRESTSVN